MARQTLPSKLLEHCGGENQPPARDYSVGRHLVGVCKHCHKVVRMVERDDVRVMRTHGTYLKWTGEGYY